MIQISRSLKPDILRNNALTWTNEYLQARADYDADKTDANKKAYQSIEKRYNQDEVKTKLKDMFHKKCAFCESFISHISYGEIEHFKPKSVYPNLCFDWDNFLLSCSVCNGKANKGDKFPLAANGGPFINPTIENPDDFFSFEYDRNLNKFIVIPKGERAITMLGIIKLNREDLVEHRSRELSKITNTIALIIQKDAKLFDEFIKQFSEKDEYYAFIKNILDKVSKALS